LRIASSRELGRYVRERRRELKQTQAGLAEAAGVSRRWLSDLEAGKPTAAVGLVLRTLQALELVVDLQLDEPAPGQVDLDEHLRRLGASTSFDEAEDRP
jgi:y4mF family transcriptional regulator